MFVPSVLSWKQITSATSLLLTFSPLQFWEENNRSWVKFKRRRNFLKQHSKAAWLYPQNLDRGMQLLVLLSLYGLCRPSRLYRISVFWSTSVHASSLKVANCPHLSQKAIHFEAQQWHFKCQLRSFSQKHLAKSAYSLVWARGVGTAAAYQAKKVPCY